MDRFPPNWPDGPFGLIAADPPWRFKSWSDKGLGRSPDRHYRTQTLDWICSLPVEWCAGRDCHLMLWITGPELVLGTHLRIFEAWGFKPSSMGFIWIKPTKAAQHGRIFAPPMTHKEFPPGLGHTTRQNAEYVVFGRRGKPTRASRGVHQILVEPRREHSRKPEDFFAKAEAFVGPDVAKLELFSRERRPGWITWGDQVDLFNKDEAA